MSVRLRYHKKLYLGESLIKKDIRKIKKKLEKRPLLSGLFLITLSRNDSDQLEIYRAKQLSQKFYQKFPPYVIGIAADYDEAIRVLLIIVNECLAECGNCLLKEYLLCQEQ